MNAAIEAAVRTADQRKAERSGETYYRLFCMNALIDGKVLFFDTDQEAIAAAVNYEAQCVKISGTDRTILYDPAEH